MLVPMNGYKIGEVSYIYGLSNDSIRYYERLGIVTPKRDNDSSYRYYDTWDVNFLIDCLRYKSYGFSLKDVEQILRADDLQKFELRCRERENELLKTIHELSDTLKQLSKMRQSIASIHARLGQFIQTESPEMIWQRQQNNHEDEKGELVQNADAETVREWVWHMNHLGHTFVMPTYGSGQEFNEYCWGFSLSPADLIRLKLDIPETAEFLPSYRSIYTVFAADDEGSFIPCLQEQVLDPIKKMNYKITDPPRGNLLVRVHEDGKMKRYIEVWVPIE